MAPRGRPPGKQSSTSHQHPASTVSDHPPSPANPSTSTPAATSSNAATSARTTQSSSSHNTNIRPPVQRLDTLKNTSSVAGVATSAAPNTSQAKKPLRAKPRFIARRSKEERDAIAAIERERLQERDTAVAEAAARLAGAGSNANRGQRDRGGRGNRGGRGRGGYMGMGGGGGGGGGTFSSGMGVDGASKRAHGLGRARLRREAESRSQGQGQGQGPNISIKRESTIKPDDDSDFSMLGIKVKKEQFDGGDISSDQEDEEGPKQDIDFINLLSSGDEEEHMGADGMPITSRVRTKSPGLAPIRIQRREHVPQDVAIKDEGGERSRSNRDSSRRNKSQHSTSRKGKTRARDVEVVKSESTWKGVYVEDDDGVKIKSEAPEDDTIAVDDIPETRSDGVVREDLEEEKQEVTKEEQPQLSSLSSPEKSKKGINKTVKHRHRKHSFRDTKGMLHTAEDRQEWNRHQESLKVLHDELGQLDLAQPAIDAEGDIRMGEMSSLHHDKKSDRVYLFQFPSVMPGLKMVAEEGKAANQANDGIESQDTTATSQMQTEAGPGPATFDQEAVKVEDDDEKEASSANERPSLWPPMASGKVGKLRVHESGRATLSWGGTSFEIAMGTDAHFLQDVVLARMPSQQQRPGEHTQGEEGVAMAMGQIRGKFVVTPDWSDIIG